MKVKNFPEANLVIGEGQKEYLPIPSYYDPVEGSVTICFELSEDEINRIRATEEIFIQVLTFGQPMQPINISALKEELI